MKNILLLTDFSKNSINAIHYAIELLKNDGCTFYLLHVKRSTAYTTDDIISSGNESVYTSIIKEVKANLDKVVTQLKKTFETENLELETLVDYDVLTDAIKQVVKIKNIDLIVMGTNGATGAKEFIFGSNTINVIRQVKCPTLTIPEGFTFNKPKEALLPLDEHDMLNGGAFKRTLEFANHFTKKIHLLRIKSNNQSVIEQKKDQEQINSFVKDLNSEYHAISEVPINYAVDCYIQTHSIDLVILLVQRETLFERFFTGSSTTKITKALRAPLLIFHY